MYHGKTVHCTPLVICAIWQNSTFSVLCALWHNSTLYSSTLCTMAKQYITFQYCVHYGTTVHCISLYFPLTLLLFLSCFLSRKWKMCVFSGGGGVAGVSSPTRGSWPGVTRWPAYQGGGAAYTCICNICSCNFSPGQYVSQDSCKKLKGDPFFMTHVWS